ncbi:MAG: type II toxin-antitoxin system prevent-host-death family antitoxin [Calothrix sp. MO_192.B10]|nr:type II toxin-antitoxin system prevent-host-death family antitoxin [Calothrix sp. MO_192.B10]
MKIVEITQANATLAEYASNLAEEPVIVTSNGKPIAALMTLENVDLETISLSSNPKFIELIERSRARRRAEGGISSKEMRRRLGLSDV